MNFKFTGVPFGQLQLTGGASIFFAKVFLEAERLQFGIELTSLNLIFAEHLVIGLAHLLEFLFDQI